MAAAGLIGAGSKSPNTQQSTSRPRDASSPIHRAPAGSCGYRNLELGRGATRCGCQQFWPTSREKVAVSGSDATLLPDERSWCMCGHHGCYHAPEAPSASSMASSVASRAHLGVPGSFSIADPGPCPSSWGQPQPLLPRTKPTDYNHVSSREHTAQGPVPSFIGTEGASRDGNLSYVSVGHLPPLQASSGASFQPHSQASTSCLPPIPSECLMDSQASHLSWSTQQLYRGGSSEPMQAFHDAPNSIRGLLHDLRSDGLPSRIALVQPPQTTGSPPAEQRSARAPSDAAPTEVLGPEAVDFLNNASGIDSPNNLGTQDLRVLRGVNRTLEEVRHQCNLLSQELGKARQTQSSRGSQVSPTASNADGIARRFPSVSSKSVPADRDYLVSRLGQMLPYLNALTSHLTAYPTLFSSLQHHARRLDSLENASFSNAPVEEVTEKTELLDGRTTELEVRVDDLDKWRASLEDDSSTARGQAKHLQGVQANESFASNGSLLSVSSSALMAAALDRADLRSRVSALEADVTDLRKSALPSIQRPWEFEVVMLPWGRGLKGIWHVAEQPRCSGNEATEAWTHSQSASALSESATLSRLDANQSGWDGPAIRRWADRTADWMSARAPGANSKAYERLRSRGLVRAVEVTGNSAREVRDAVMSGLGNLPKMLSREAASQPFDSISSDGSGYSKERSLGLLAPFIPLRKIHKQSRLEFLTRDEMASSSLWTAEFLACSVAMKVAGQRRLYVTLRDGYLQPNGDDEAWTWKRIQELPVHAENDDTTDADEARRWSWHPRLDSPVDGSFSEPSQASLSLRHRDAQSSRSSSAFIASRSASPRREPISPLSEFPPSGPPPHHRRSRTVSVPLLQTAPIQTTSKRRVASHDLLSPSKATSGGAPHKRQRISRSPPLESASSMAVPSLLRRTSSTAGGGPPSPFFSEAHTSEARAHTRSSAGFAYATPHSGIVPVERRGRAESEEEGGEAEWEGVGEDDDHDEDEDDASSSEDGIGEGDEHGDSPLRQL